MVIGEGGLLVRFTRTVRSATQMQPGFDLHPSLYMGLRNDLSWGLGLSTRVFWIGWAGHQKEDPQHSLWGEDLSLAWGAGLCHKAQSLWMQHRGSSLREKVMYKQRKASLTMHLERKSNPLGSWGRPEQSWRVAPVEEEVLLVQTVSPSAWERQPKATTHCRHRPFFDFLWCVRPVLAQSCLL